MFNDFFQLLSISELYFRNILYPLFELLFRSKYTH